MDVTTQIQAIIELIKAMPNSLARNKAVSHLEDARVWSKELNDRFRGLTPDQQPPTAKSDECICPAQGRRVDCPIHGNK